jgi:hypothetical protein
MDLPVPEEKSFTRYVVPWNEKDQRVMGAFDGDLPFGALPSSAHQVHSVVLCTFKKHARNVRVAKAGESPATYEWVVEGSEEFARVTLIRRFLLLPAASLVVCRYRQNLSPWYAHVEVRKGENDTANVTWRNT